MGSLPAILEKGRTYQSVPDNENQVLYKASFYEIQ
jgi:hypothetical protein